MRILIFISILFLTTCEDNDASKPSSTHTFVNLMHTQVEVQAVLNGVSYIILINPYSSREYTFPDCERAPLCFDSVKHTGTFNCHEDNYVQGEDYWNNTLYFGYPYWMKYTYDNGTYPKSEFCPSVQPLL